MIQHIGVTGHARHGKDSVANFLKTHLQYHCRQEWTSESLIGPVKRHLGALMGFTWEQMNGPRMDEVDPRWGCTPRWALQVIITDLLKKQFDPEFLYKIPDCPLRKTRVIIPNVRNPDEEEAIHKLGGIIIRVVRPHAPPIEEKSAAHEVERNIDLVKHDHLIMNDCSLTELELEVEKLVKQLKHHFKE
jgi:hypothetical protein